MVFDETSTRRNPTIWGEEVQVRLMRQRPRMKQDELVRLLNERGHDIDKNFVSDLIYGVRATSDKGKAVIAAINEILDIPFQYSA